MPIFYLEPRDGVTSDLRWEATTLREGCWTDAGSEADARQAVALLTIQMIDFRPGEKTLISPWYDPALTDCRPDKPPLQVPEGIIVTVTGRTIS
jgi:hypothetical protein